MIIIIFAIILAALGMFLRSKSDSLMYQSYYAKDSWYEYMARKKSNAYHITSILCLTVSLFTLLIGVFMT